MLFFTWSIGFEFESRVRGYKTFFMLNSVAHKIYPAHKWAVSWENLDICICENKATDQLRANREANQRFCFHYIDSIIPLLFKSEISNI